MNNIKNGQQYNKPDFARIPIFECLGWRFTFPWMCPIQIPRNSSNQTGGTQRRTSAEIEIVIN